MLWCTSVITTADFLKILFVGLRAPSLLITHDKIKPLIDVFSCFYYTMPGGTSRAHLNMLLGEINGAIKHCMTFMANEYGSNAESYSFGGCYLDGEEAHPAYHYIVVLYDREGKEYELVYNPRDHEVLDWKCYDEEEEQQ